MDIRAITPTVPTAPAAAPAPGQGVPNTNPRQAVERNLHETSGGAGPAGRPPHTEIQFDDNLNRVVGRIVNEQTGKTIQEILPKQPKALYTKMREQLGPLVDGTA